MHKTRSVVLCCSLLLRISRGAPCVCEDTWTSPEDGANCTNPQNGCAFPTCDGDPRPWCIVTHFRCDEDIDLWTYCDRPPRPPSLPPLPPQPPSSPPSPLPLVPPTPPPTPPTSPPEKELSTSPPPAAPRTSESSSVLLTIFVLSCFCGLALGAISLCRGQRRWMRSRTPSTLNFLVPIRRSMSSIQRSTPKPAAVEIVAQQPLGQEGAHGKGGEQVQEDRASTR